MEHLDLKPGHAAVKAYYGVLGQYGQLHIDHEMAVRSAFQDLLASCARKFHWTLVPEFSIERKGASPIRVDGAVLDTFSLTRGLWEAKDSHDDLDKEIKAKLAVGYPKQNIIFQAPERAVLYQNGMRQGLNEDIRDTKNLVELLKQFFDYRLPHHEEWERAVEEFRERLPEIAKAAQKLIEKERQTNTKFVQSFEGFYAVCRQAINPNLSDKAVEEMLVQHLLTERIFRKIFDNPDFTRRNVVAVEIEKVIDSLTSRHFNRDAFLRDLDRFYKAIELSAENTENFSEKQAFLNTVYERFFQGYSPKEADTHGIVYTPQAIVNFMVRSVEEILRKEFGRSLSDRDVHILDPFVGTGNFIVRVMREIRTSALPYKYENELHCNEVMLLPYYVASMNIEHEYLERTGEYKAFPGICLVDTFDMRAQASMFAEQNTARIERQRLQPIFVVVGNPPYNAWQVNENDGNKNRKYGAIANRVSETYAKSSTATNKNALSDPYVKAIRWASDRIGEEGIVALVTNSGFVDGLATDGMRAHLAADFDEIYLLDLGGNVRKNPRLSGTTHNVFGIQVGVSVNIFVRRSVPKEKRVCKIVYASSESHWTRWQKYEWLEQIDRVSGTKWVELRPDASNRWVSDGVAPEFNRLIGLEDIFLQQSRGIATLRDVWAYNFDAGSLKANIKKTIAFYNEEVNRWRSSDGPSRNIDEFVRYEENSISWSRDLKEDLRRERQAAFAPSKIRACLYRPFTKQNLFFDRVLNEEVYVFPSFFPTQDAEAENRLMCLTGPGSEKPFLVLAAKNLVDLHLSGAGCSTQCFPFYTYAEDGSNRCENITDWALEQFRTRYGHRYVSKWDIFHYTYAALHHPTYRERYAANLRRELPRIPFLKAGPLGSGEGHTEEKAAAGKPMPEGPPSAEQLVKGRRFLDRLDQAHRAGTVRLPPAAGAHLGDVTLFWRLAKAGERLADLHVNYEKQPEYPLRRTETGKLDWRVEKMRLNKDKTSLVYNSFLTLGGIPPETYEYRLGNRSALEWVIDQYQVSTDKRSGITNDPNRADDPEYIVRLIGQVVYVSLETVKVVKGLPEFVVETGEAAKV